MIDMLKSTYIIFMHPILSRSTAKKMLILENPCFSFSNQKNIFQQGMKRKYCIFTTLVNNFGIQTNISILSYKCYQCLLLLAKYTVAVIEAETLFIFKLYRKIGSHTNLSNLSFISGYS